MYCWLSTIPLGENGRLITFLLQKLSFIQNRFIAIVVQQQLYSSFGPEFVLDSESEGGGGDSTLSIPDFKFHILDSLSLELKFQIAIVRGIPDSRGQDFWFHNHEFPGSRIWIPLYGANYTAACAGQILLDTQRRESVFLLSAAASNFWLF